MSRGAKKGENRFSGSQEKRQNFRIERIKSHVIPKLKALAGKVSINGQTPFCKLCASIYNENLPVNEKRVGYRTFEQNTKYWEIVGTTYYTYWGSDDDITAHRKRVMDALTAKESSRLKEENKRLKQKIDALRAALKAHGAEDKPRALPSEDHPKTDKTADFDRVCRALKLVIDSSEDIFDVHEEEMKITCNLYDLEPTEGLVPKSLAEPFIRWLQERREKMGGDHE
jgi:hypothetical protein